MTEPRALGGRALDLQLSGDRRGAAEVLKEGVALADRQGSAQDQIALRLALADLVDSTESRKLLLLEALDLATASDDTFGAGAAADGIAALTVERDRSDGLAWLRRARDSYRAASRPRELARVLLRIVEFGADEDVQSATGELDQLAERIPPADQAGLRGTTALALADRLMQEDRDGEALLQLSDAHESLLRAGDGRGAIAAGLRLNSVLLRLHPAWESFPIGSDLEERFLSSHAIPPPAESDLMLSWNFDPRNLPLTARHFRATDSRNGWVLWSGDEPTETPGYLPVALTEVVRWLPQVEPYLALPEGWSFQIAPSHEDVWEEPHLLADD